jgi:hypothetical protein
MRRFEGVVFGLDAEDGDAASILEESPDSGIVVDEMRAPVGGLCDVIGRHASPCCEDRARSCSNGLRPARAVDLQAVL